MEVLSFWNTFANTGLSRSRTSQTRVVVPSPWVSSSSSSPWRKNPRDTLFHGEDVDRTNVGVARQKVGADCGECLRDLAIDVRLAGFDGLEGVEDAVGRVADLEGVPGHSPLLLKGELPACYKKRCKLGSLVGLCFEKGEQSKLHGHLRSPFCPCVEVKRRRGGGWRVLRRARCEAAPGRGVPG